MKVRFKGLVLEGTDDGGRHRQTLQTSETHSFYIALDCVALARQCSYFPIHGKRYTEIHFYMLEH